MKEISESLQRLLLGQQLYKQGKFTSTELFADWKFVFTGRIQEYHLQDDFLVIEVSSLTATRDGEAYPLPYTNHVFSARLDSSTFHPTSGNCYEIITSGLGIFCFFPNPALQN